MTAALYPPTTEQIHLLRAALCPPEEALAHWQAWRRLRGLHGSTPGHQQITNTLALLDATQQRLLPLIYQNIRQLDDALLPSLQQIYAAAACQHGQRLGAEQALLQELVRGGINPLVLGGALIMATPLPGVGLQPTHSLELLVPKAQAEATLRALERQGLLPTEFRRRHRRWLAPVLLARPDGMRVRLLPTMFVQHAYPRADAPFWQAAQALALPGGQSVPTLSPTHRLFYALVRGGQGGRKAAFASIPDSIGLIRHENIDWDSLFDLTEHFTFKLPVRRSLSALQAHADLTLPPLAEQRFRSIVPTIAEQRYFDLLNAVATKMPGRRHLLKLRIGRLAFNLFREKGAHRSLSNYLLHNLAPQLVWPDSELLV